MTTETNSSSRSSSPLPLVQATSFCNPCGSRQRSDQITKSHEEPKSETKRLEEVNDRKAISKLLQKRDMSFGRCSCSSGSKSRDTSSDSNRVHGSSGVTENLKVTTKQKKPKPTEKRQEMTEQKKNKQSNRSLGHVAQSGKKTSVGSGPVRMANNSDSETNFQCESRNLESRARYPKELRKLSTQKDVDNCVRNDEKHLHPKVNTADICDPSERKGKFLQNSKVFLNQRMSCDQIASSSSGSTETTETSFTSTDSLNPNDNDDHLSDLIHARIQRGHFSARWATSKDDESTDCGESDYNSDKSLNITSGSRLPSTPDQVKSKGLAVQPRRTVGFWDNPPQNVGNPLSVIEAKHGEDESKPNIPRRALWRQANQWLTKCRVVIVTITQVLQILTNHGSVKALAEYPFP